jgi:hypothetical protein
LLSRQAPLRVVPTATVHLRALSSSSSTMLASRGESGLHVLAGQSDGHVRRPSRPESALRSENVYSQSGESACDATCWISRSLLIFSQMGLRGRSS